MSNVKINKRKIEAMAYADLNEMLLMQDKDFNQESKDYAMELYRIKTAKEVPTQILWERKNNKIIAEHNRMETLK